jgi:hypothetical protein
VVGWGDEMPAPTAGSELWFFVVFLHSFTRIYSVESNCCLELCNMAESLAPCAPVCELEFQIFCSVWTRTRSYDLDHVIFSTCDAVAHLDLEFRLFFFYFNLI